MALYIGLDVGSVSADFVVTDGLGNVLESRYVRVFGRPMQVALEELEGILGKYGRVGGLCTTGSGAEGIARLLGVPSVNEIVAQSRATARLCPQVRTIIEIGGAEAKLILLERDGDGSLRVGDFAMNDICAAGTGSFLDQQASRLRVSIEEFGELALKSEHPARVAGRCSVFAKSDMIHLQQQGTPDYDIIAGLCHAMARNLKNNIGRGKRFVKPIAFQGGVAANAGMVQAFTEVLGLEEGELVIPPYFNCTGALGAVLTALESGGEMLRRCRFESLDALRAYIDEMQADAERLPPLRGDGYKIDVSCRDLGDEAGGVDAYVGVDVGSISTNVVVMDQERRVLARRYLMTEGRPLEAIKRGLYEVGREVGEKVKVRGCATTGSGRYLTGEFIGADVIINEITSHATGAIHADPEVDTIFEIGGQDAKYICIEGGAVVDFAMNKVCAAGTGSFLEEQAQRLGLRIEEQFGGMALSSESPVHLGERCTVFMESDLNFHQQRGLPMDDLVAGLCYSVVYNYLNRVVEDRRIGDRILFQGGVTYNRGVKAAFEQITGKRILVPPHHDIMGAIGAAMIAMEKVEGASRFRGFDLRKVNYELKTFECRGCSNRCEIHRVSVEAQRPLFYGSRCGKYDQDKRHKKGERLPKLFEERGEILLDAYPGDEPEHPVGVSVGIPRTAIFFDLYPLWKAFFTEIGCKVVLSDPTNRQTVQRGGEAVCSESCLPIHVAHGHVVNLLEKGVDYIFLPSVVSLEHETPRIVHSYSCPLVQSLPYTIRAAFDFDATGTDLIAPIFHFEDGREAVNQVLRDLGQMVEVAPHRVHRAIRAGWKALDAFRTRIRERGREILRELGDELALVIVSRPYNGCDPALNLALPEKLRDLGVLAIPLDFLPLDLREIQDDFPHMYWKYGQRILAGAKFMAGRDNLHAVYITNFRCGPDSFISKFFGRVLGKPYLTLEIDEHSSDVGAMTRCEAFLDSLRNSRGKEERKAVRAKDLFFDIRRRAKDLKVYIPYMDDHGRMLAATFRAHGLGAEALPMSDAASLDVGRSLTTGKECYPCILTTGDIVKKTRAPDFDPDSAAFFMAQANGPCRFGQYHKFHRMVLDDLGLEQVPMVVIDQTEEWVSHVQSLGPETYRALWDLSVIVDFLKKMACEIRPYEVHKGETEKVYEQCLRHLEQVTERNQDYFAAAAELRRRMEAIPIDRSEARPLVGVVGEIYVRSNAFANNFLVHKLEELGAQVVMPPLQEWLNYIAYDRREVYWQSGSFWSFFKEWMAEWVSRWDAGRVARLFNGAVTVMPREARTAEVLRLGRRYIHPSVKGEAILSLGRAVEYVHHGLNGIVNVAPFGCMPGAIVNGLLERFRREHGAIPVLTMEYDGQGRAAERTKLEAFVHQCRQQMLCGREALLQAQR